MVTGSFGKNRKDKSMFEDLLKKVDFDYQEFLLLLKALPREDIISRANEISYKAAAYRRLQESLKNGELNTDSSVYNNMLNAENTIAQLYLTAKNKGLLTLNNGEIPGDVWLRLLDAAMF